MFDFFDNVWNWLTEGIYDVLSDALAALIEFLVEGYLDLLLWAVPFAWGVAQTVIQDLQLSQHINTAWSLLPTQAANTLAFFRIPEVIVIIVSAYAARLVLRFIPFV